MSLEIPKAPPFYISASKLSHYCFCGKRSKLEALNKVGYIDSKSKGAVSIGNRMHYLYSYGNKNFDRLMLRLKLNNYTTTIHGRRVFRKQVNNIIVVGMYDDLRVIRDLKNKKKYSVLVEVKTTNKKYMWSPEVNAAVKQLQLYMWLMKEPLEKYGIPLWKRGYVEIYSQKSGNLLKSVTVEYDDNIEEWIQYVIDSFRGLKPMRMPHIKVCKFCPRNVKLNCDWYSIIKGNRI